MDINRVGQLNAEPEHSRLPFTTIMDPHHDARSGVRASQTNARRHLEVHGNVADPRMLTQQRIPGEFPVDGKMLEADATALNLTHAIADARYHLAQVNPDYTSWSFTTIAWSTLGALCFWISSTSPTARQGGVHPAADPDDPPPPYTSGSFRSFFPTLCCFLTAFR